MKQKIDRITTGAKSISLRTLAMVLCFVMLLSAIGVGTVVTAIAKSSNAKAAAAGALSRAVADVAVEEEDDDDVVVTKKSDSDLADTGAADVYAVAGSWDNWTKHYFTGSTGSATVSINLADNTSYTFKIYSSYSKTWYGADHTFTGTQSDYYFMTSKEQIGRKAELVYATAPTPEQLSSLKEAVRRRYGLEPGELNLLERLFRGEYYLSQRILIDGALECGSEVTHFTALNDIAVSGVYGKVFDFSVFSDDHMIGRYRADGMVCSTPTGSTAYALSAGGPLMEPELSLIEITLICPHSLFNRPLLLSADRTVTIRHAADDSRDIILSADGERPVPFPPDAQLTIRRSESMVSIIHLHSGSFYDAVSRKLMQSIKGFGE